MSFLQKAIRIQSEIQNLPLESIGYQTLESKQQSSVRIAHLIDEQAKELDLREQIRLREEFDGTGPLAPLFDDPEVTEILVNSMDQIWFEKNGSLHALPDRFATDLTFENFIERVCQEARVQVSLERPFCDGNFRGFRLHLASGALTQGSPVITLRRQNKAPWTFESLEKQGWSTPQAICILQKWIAAKKNFLIIGETGSGKTSVLNACLQEVPSNQRMVCLEDTSELILPNPASARLMTRIDSQGLLPAIDLTELLRQSLRMRPDRLIVGEVRSGEAKDLLLALSTGHQGSLGTLHASTAAQAILRLEMLVQLGAPQWSLSTIRRLLGLSLNGIVTVGKNSNGKRKLKAIHEITAVEETGVLLDVIFQEDFEN